MCVPRTPGVTNPDIVEAGVSLLERRLPAGMHIKGRKHRVRFGKPNARHHRQQHLVSRRLGDSASTPETSPALLRMTVNGIQGAAEPLRPYCYQEVQGA